MATNYATSLQKINPTEGLVSYVNAVKPYHTKVLDVLITYIYSDQLSGTMTESYSTAYEYTLQQRPTVMSCGYGNIWDSVSYTNSKVYDISTINRILHATGTNTATVSTVAAGSSDLTILSAVTETLATGQVVTIEAITSLPASAPQLTTGLNYIVQLITPDTIQLTEQSSGTTLVFNGGFNDQFNLVITGDAANSFLVEQTQWPAITAVCLNTQASLFLFANPYLIVGIDGNNNEWIVSDNVQSLLPPGEKIYINTGTLTANSKQYAVVSTTFDGTNTHVVVDNPVFQPIGLSYVYIPLSPSSLPAWLPGVAVKVQTNGNIPLPLTTTDMYYFIPSSQTGIFNLSATPYPQESTNFVHLTTVGNGIFSVLRQDTYMPGDVIRVSGTYMSINNGLYSIREVVNISPTQVLIYPVEPILQSTPLGRTVDGIIETIILGYSDNRYCVPVSSGPMDLNGFVVETLNISIDLVPTDYVEGTVVEIDTTNTLTQSTIENIPMVQVLPTGIDGQLFDVGAMDESIDTLPRTSLGENIFG